MFVIYISDHVMHTYTGMEVVCSYTVVRKSLLPNQQDTRQDQGKVIYLMIKIYPQGSLTPLLGRLQPGNRDRSSSCISLYICLFSFVQVVSF